MFKVGNLSVSIARPPPVVYDYLAEPTNLPHWTMVLGPRFRPIDARHWVAEEPLLETGPIIVGFMPRNRFGVVDYEFSYAGRTMTFPVRVVANDEGSEVTVTFFVAPEASDEHMKSEMEWIQTDLLTLKTLLEG